MEEVRALTGLRGIAALLVVVAHYEIGTLWFLNRFGLHVIAVDLFFCLSGFTLAMVYSRLTPTVANLAVYGTARFARVAPLYYLTLVWTFLAVKPITGPLYATSSALRDLAAQMAFVNGWPFVGSGVHWNLPAWSISVEAFCYLAVFPLLWRSWRRRSHSLALIIIALCTVIPFLALRYTFDWQIFRIQDYESPVWLAYYNPLLRGVSGFTGGYLVYNLLQAQAPSATAIRRHADWAMLALAALALIFVFITEMVPSYVLIFAFPPLIVAIMNESSLSARFLASFVPYRLGVYSYTIYLVHVPLKLTVERFWPGATARGLGQFALLSALMLSAFAIYHLFEMPLRSWLRQFSHRRTSAGEWALLAAITTIPAAIPYAMITWH